MAELSESRNTARDAIVRPLSRAAERPCSRPGCPSPSRATLDFSYTTRTVRLTSLSDERSPESYDLCANHADRTSPPFGWELADERSDDRDDLPTSPDHLDSPRTVAVLAAALRGVTEEDAPEVDADPLREALEELQAVAATPEGPLAEPRPLRAEAPPEADLDLEALTAILTSVEDGEDLPTPEVEQIELLTLALAEAEAAEAERIDLDAPGRPVLAHRARTTDDDGRATLW